MSKNVNLLPVELAASKGIGKLARVSSTVVLFFASLVVVVVLIGGATLLFLINQRSNLRGQRDELLTTAASLESTENGLFLTRDRLGKIEPLLADRSVEDNFLKQDRLVGLIRQNIDFKESQVSGRSSTVLLESDSSVAISDLFDSFFGDEIFSDLKLKTLEFSAFTGYKLEFEVL